MKLRTLALVLLLLPVVAYAQTTISVEEAILAALKQHPNIIAADLEIEQQKQLQKTAFNIVNPSLYYEKEKGMNYGLGVIQEINFPTVYMAQSKLQKQRTALSETQKLITVNDLKQEVRRLYLNAQYQNALVTEYQLQDGIYRRFADAAKRHFDAGQIDYLQKIYAEAKAAEVKNIYSKAIIQAAYGSMQLKTFLGREDSLIIDTLVRFTDQPFTKSLAGNPYYQFADQQIELNKKNVNLEWNKIIPSFIVDYQKNSPFDANAYTKFNFGLRIPLWFWQYSGNIKSANAGFKAAEQRKAAILQNTSTLWKNAMGNYSATLQSLNFYETTALQQSADIIKTSARFLTSGESDYINFIRNITDAYTIRVQYIESLKDYNQSIIEINYLSGN